MGIDVAFRKQHATIGINLIYICGLQILCVVFSLFSTPCFSETDKTLSLGMILSFRKVMFCFPIGLARFVFRVSHLMSHTLHHIKESVVWDYFFKIVSFYVRQFIHRIQVRDLVSVRTITYLCGRPKAINDFTDGICGTVVKTTGHMKDQAVVLCQSRIQDFGRRGAFVHAHTRKVRLLIIDG